LQEFPASGKLIKKISAGIVQFLGRRRRGERRREEGRGKGDKVMVNDRQAFLPFPIFVFLL